MGLSEVATIWKALEFSLPSLQLYFAVLLPVIIMPINLAEEQLAESETGSCLMQSLHLNPVSRSVQKLKEDLHIHELEETNLTLAANAAAMGEELTVDQSGQSNEAIEQPPNTSESIVRQQQESANIVLMEPSSSTSWALLNASLDPTRVTAPARMDMSIQNGHTNSSLHEFTHDSLLLFSSAFKPTPANITKVANSDGSSETGHFSATSSVKYSWHKQVIEKKHSISMVESLEEGINFLKTRLQNRKSQTEVGSTNTISVVGMALHLLIDSAKTPTSLMFLACGAGVVLLGVISIAALALYKDDCEDSHEGKGRPLLTNDGLTTDLHKMPLSMSPVNFTPRSSEAKSIRSTAAPISDSHLHQAPASPMHAPIVSPNPPARSQSPESIVIDRSLSGRAAGDQYLCPELVTPLEGECCLVLPKVPLHVLQALRLPSVPMPRMAGSDFEYPITDMNGVVVLLATFMLPSLASRSNGDNSRKGRILLCSPTEGKTILAYLTEAQSGTSNRQSVMTVHSHNGTLFGSLRAEVGDSGSCYTYSSCVGSRLYFSGDFQFDRVSSGQGQCLIFDANKELQAFVKPRLLDQSSRSVRVGPEIDVACILLCLFGIDVLELEGHE